MRFTQFEDWYTSGGGLTALETHDAKEQLRLAFEAGKRSGRASGEEHLFTHHPDEQKNRLPDEPYLTWLKRTLSFSRTFGKTASDGTWTCGYCALDRHEDCIVDCGCPDPRCQPHSSGTTGAGIHEPS